MIDKAETEMRAEVKAALQILELYPTIRWPAITVSELDQSVRLWVTFPHNCPQPTFGVAKWTITTAAMASHGVFLVAERCVPIVNGVRV